MINISVIVPVYNTEKYLDRCIQSILAQTYADFELLLIDDGSTDSSGAICDKYAEQDSRIRVFHKENGGVSSARNLGLDNARGEWITFVDSDDWVGCNLLSNLKSASSINDDTDLVISMSVNVYPSRIVKPELFKGRRINNENFYLLFTKYQLSWRTSPWGKLYKKQIINKHNLKFDKCMPIGEDLVFLYTYLSFIDNIYISDKIDYYYNVGIENSLTKKRYQFETETYCMNNIHKVILNLEYTKQITNEIAIKELEWLRYSYLNRVINSLYNYKINRKERINRLRQLDFSSYISYMENARKTVKSLISLCLLKNNLFYCYDFFRLANKILNMNKNYE